MEKTIGFRQSVGKRTYDENLQYITNWPELEYQQVDKSISDMKKLAQQMDSDRRRYLKDIEN